MPLLDTLGRPLGSLRLSVTDRCNLRCHYCMPEDEYLWLPREDVLTFEEIGRLADLFGEVGRRSPAPHRRRAAAPPRPAVARRAAGRAALAARPRAHDQRRAARRRGGRPQARRACTASPSASTRCSATGSSSSTRIDALPRRARRHRRRPHAPGFPDLKLDTVVTRGDNDDELVDLRRVRARRSARRSGSSSTWTSAAPPPGGRTRSSRGARCSSASRTTTARSTPIDETSSAPAARFRLPDGLTFGIISSTTQPFCRTCDRARLTADGVLLLCLYAQHGTDLRRPLRAGRVTRDAAEPDPRRLGRPRRSRRRRTPRRARPRRLHPAERPQEGRASGNAHAGRMTAMTQ